MRFLLISLMITLHGLCVPAQSPSYIHYGVSEGLPSNKVYCAVQDYRGFIWFGTDKGLARFDGTRFQVYGVKDGLPDPEILSLFEDSQRRLWISCFSRTPCYMLDGKIITARNNTLLAQIDIKESLWVFSEDKEHQVWIAGRSPVVFVFDGKTIRKEIFQQTIARVEQIGELRFDLGTAHITQRDIGLQYDLNTAVKVFKSVAVSNNQILYSLIGEMILLEWTNGKIVELDRIKNTEGGIYTDTKGGFWLCPDSKGAICFGSHSRNLSHPVQYLSDEKVNSMLEDRHGTLWFCTGGNGVFALSPGKAATYTKTDGLATNNITALARNPKGQVLAGDDFGNFYQFSGKNIQRKALDQTKEYNRCRQIIPLSGDTYWVANDKGLYFQVGNTIQKIKVKIQALSGLKTILSTRGRLWYGYA